jgi:hypothetical protein
MRRAVAWSVGVALVAGASGCRSNNCALVESELRARESDVRELREELDRSAFHNQLLQRELSALKGEPGPDGHVHPPGDVYPVRSLTLGRQTGGRAADCGGDDALVVVVEPRDPDGQPIKVPGALRVLVQEVSAEGLKKPLSTWEVPPPELRKSWRNGLFNTGYVLTLPWKVWPSTDKLRVTAQLRLADGRLFEADKDVTVRLPPARPAAPPTPPPAAPDIPAPTVPDAPAPPAPQPQTLPPPRPVEPPAGGPRLDPAVHLKPAQPPSPAIELLRPVVPVDAARVY